MSDTATESVPRTFRVGDRVRYHGADRMTTTPELEGHLGTVTDVAPDDVRVRWDIPTSVPAGVLPANLEPLDDASDSEPRRPVVGDRLRITVEDTHSSGYHVGETVEVVSVSGDPVHTIRAQRIEGNRAERFIRPDGTGWEFLTPAEDVRTPTCDICGKTDEESDEWCGECGNCTAHHGPGCDVFGATEPIPVGTVVRVLPEPKMDHGGNVYWGNVTQGVVVAYGYPPEGPDVRVEATVGETLGHRTQSVGRRYLRKIMQPSDSEAFVPDVLPGMEALEVERLRRELAEAQSRIRGMEADVAVIGEMFGRAAVKENLCGVYERTVERVNERLSFVTLDAERPAPATVTATRVRKMEVWVEETGTLECSDHDDDCEHDEGDFTWEDRGYTEHVVAAARENFDETQETDDFTITS